MRSGWRSSKPDLIVTQELCAVCAVSYEIVERAAKRLRGDPRVISLEPSSLEDVYATIVFLGELDRSRARRGGSRRRLALARSRVAQHAARRAAARADSRMDRPADERRPLDAGPRRTRRRHSAARQSRRELANAGVGCDRRTPIPTSIIVVPCGFDLERARTRGRRTRDNATWNALRAVRGGHAYVMDGNAYVNRPGPRLIDSAERFAWAFDDARRLTIAADPSHRPPCTLSAAG